MPPKFEVDPDYNFVKIYPLKRVLFPERIDQEPDSTRVGDSDFRETLNLSHFESDQSDVVDKYLDSCMSALYLVLKAKEIQLIVVDASKSQFAEITKGTPRGNDFNIFLTNNKSTIEKLESQATWQHNVSTAYFMLKLRKSLLKQKQTTLIETLIEDITVILRVKFDDVTSKSPDIKKLKRNLANASDRAGGILEPFDKMYIRIIAHVTAFTRMLYINRSLHPYRLRGHTFQEYLENSLYRFSKGLTEPVYLDEKIYDLSGLIEYYIRKIQQISVICDHCGVMIPNELILFCEYCGVAGYCKKQHMLEHERSHENMCLIIRKVWNLSIDNYTRNGCKVM